MRAALYLRVSTRSDKRDDDAVRQRNRRTWKTSAASSGILRRSSLGNCRRIYVDEDSGAKATARDFSACGRTSSSAGFDVLLFWALDRFSREGVLETVNYLKR